MDYEKKYKEALERAQQAVDKGQVSQNFVDDIFPEHKGSRDERIRNFLFDFIKICTWTEKKNQGWPSREDCLAWLEKQGEDKHTDKVEPKFKVGEWIVGNDGVFKITQYEDEYGYELTDTTGYIAHFISPDYVESNFHLWTIADAKDGDMLYLQHEGVEHVIIYKRLVKKNFHTILSVHCAYDGSTNDFFDDVDFYHCITSERDEKEIHPATKEQRDLLFQKMKEAGYEWDNEKKDLK